MYLRRAAHLYLGVRMPQRQYCRMDAVTAQTSRRQLYALVFTAVQALACFVWLQMPWKSAWQLPHVVFFAAAS